MSLIHSGNVPSIDVVIIRKFSMMYIETCGETKIVRNEQEEFQAQEEFQKVCCVPPSFCLWPPSPHPL